MATSHNEHSIGVTSNEVMAENQKRISATFINDNAANVIYLQKGTPATVNSGIRLNAGGGSYEINLTNPYNGKLYAVATGASTLLLVTEDSA